MKTLFLRRKGLGLGSLRGVVTALNESDTPPRSLPAGGYTDLEHGYIRHDLANNIETDWLVRWGCTAETNTPAERQLNLSSAIHRVNNKRDFRMLLQENEVSVPTTITNLNDAERLTYPAVVRKARHAQGRGLWLVNTPNELRQCVQSRGLTDFYASNYIPKTAEYRVYVVHGRCAMVARKTPADPNAVAWNVAQGGRFDNVRWDEWPLRAIRESITAAEFSGLDFCGVDVMIGPDNTPYIIEINSAPSLPLNEDGSVSYRQRCMAKVFEFITTHGTYDNHGNNVPECATNPENWRDVIHPAIWSRS